MGCLKLAYRSNNSPLKVVFRAVKTGEKVVQGFTSPDPLAELSRRWSPYTYGKDNPIRFIDPDGMFDVDINGPEKDKAFEELQKSMEGQLTLSMNANGKVSYQTNIPAALRNDGAKQLMAAIDDHSVVVNVNTTNEKTTSGGNLFIGGAFGGNTVTPGAPGASATVSANQEVNPTVLAASDAPYGKPGANMLHEVTEAYQGAKLSQASGISSGNSNTVGTVYPAAHAAATPQAGPIGQTVKDQFGFNPGHPMYNGNPNRVIYTVTPPGKPSVEIMRYP